MKKNTDVLIIGFGKAGKTLAGKLAAHGRKVIIVEEDATRYGGTCINVACLPTKFLVNSAEDLSNAKELGLKLTQEETANHYKKIVQDKKVLIGKLRNANYNMLAKLDTVEVITGKATFKSNELVEIKTADDTHEVTADHIIINTGSSAVIPEVKGLELGDRIYDNVTYMDEERFIPRLAILGAGYIGLEFSDMALKFGSQVTLIHNSNRFLTREDADDRDALKAHLEQNGANLLLNTKLLEVKHNENSLTLALQDSEGKLFDIEVDGLLVATGRRANTAGLGLENTTLEVNKDGSIQVDENLKTNVKNIWAAGDVKGGLQFTYISLDDSRIILPQLSGKISSHGLNSRGAVPYTVFLAPPYSRVGLNETEAERIGIPYQVYNMPVSEIPKAKITKATEGHWKILLSESGTVLGATLFGAESQELINILTFAVNDEWHYTKLSDQIYNHPTMVEGFNMIFTPQWKVK
ncbi:MAG: FAD-dependent oxidoreductase [Clostridiaceae bacterium]